MKEINLVGLNETIYTDTLNNGLKVYLWVNKKVNSYYATLSIKYGSIFNEFNIGNKKYKMPYGLAHFLEHVKFNEKKGFTAHDYYSKNTCDTNAFTTFNYTNFQVYGTENAKENINHLVDFVLNDYFTKPIVANEKGIIIEEAKMGQDDPYTIMLFKTLDCIFNSYDHKEYITGKPEDIKKITIDDIKLVHKAFYHPKNMFLIVTGNFDPYEVLEYLKEKQNDFEKYFLDAKRVVKKEKNKINIAHKEFNVNLSSRKIKIGVKIPKKKFKDYDEKYVRLYLSILLKANFGMSSDFYTQLIEKSIINDMSYIMEILDDYIVIIFTIDSNYKDEIKSRFEEAFEKMDIDEKTFKRIRNANIANLILAFENVDSVNSYLQNEILIFDKVIDNIKEIYNKLSYKKIKEINKLLSFDERCFLVFNPLEDNKKKNS